MVLPLVEVRIRAGGEPEMARAPGPESDTRTGGGRGRSEVRHRSTLEGHTMKKGQTVTASGPCICGLAWCGSPMGMATSR